MIIRLDRKGFTLIELVIVIAILSILSAIAFFNFQQSKITASIVAHNANVRTLEGAAYIYISDYGEPSQDLSPAEIKKIFLENPKYLDSWPENPRSTGYKNVDNKEYQVTISKGGIVKVNPEKIDN